MQAVHQRSVQNKQYANQRKQSKAQPQVPLAPSRAARRALRAISTAVSAPAAQGVRRAGNFNPQVSASSRGGKVSVFIKSPPGGEFVTDLLAVSTGAFTVGVNQGVNPGNQVLFPWLSTIAAKFEGYRFRMLRFRAESEAPTSSVGAVLLAFDPNAQDSAPATKQEFLDLAAHARAPVWSNVDLNVPLQEMDLLGMTRFVRAGAVPSGADSKTYDVGTFMTAFSSTTSASNLNELYAEYDIELIGMQQNPSGIINARSIRIASGGTTSRTAPFGAAPTTTGGAPITALNSTLTFNQPGQYLVTMDLVGTVIANVSPTIGGTATAAIASALAIYSPTAATSGLLQLVVTATAAAQTVTLDFSPSATTITATVTRCAQYLASLG